MRGWSWRRQEAYEIRKGYDVAQDGRTRCGKVGRILWRRVDETGGGRQRTFFREKLVGYSHLDVVGFAGKHLDRFVLRFPAEPGNGSIVPADIGMACNPETLFESSVRGHVGVEGGFGYVLNQTCSKHGRGNAEDEIFQLLHLLEVGLRHVAAGGVASTGDGK